MEKECMNIFLKPFKYIIDAFKYYPYTPSEVEKFRYKLSKLWIVGSKWVHHSDNPYVKDIIVEVIGTNLPHWVQYIDDGSKLWVNTELFIKMYEYIEPEK
jgi:hypothetical protein